MKHIADILDGKEKKGFDNPDDRYARHLQKVDEFMRNRLTLDAYTFWAFCYAEGDSWADDVHATASDIVTGRRPEKKQPWLYDARDYAP